MFSRDRELPPAALVAPEPRRRVVPRDSPDRLLPVRGVDAVEREPRDPCPAREPRELFFPPELRCPVDCGDRRGAATFSISASSCSILRST